MHLLSPHSGPGKIYSAHAAGEETGTEEVGWLAEDHPALKGEKQN